WGRSATWHSGCTWVSWSARAADGEQGQLDIRRLPDRKDNGPRHIVGTQHRGAGGEVRSAVGIEGIPQGGVRGGWLDQCGPHTGSADLLRQHLVKPPQPEFRGTVRPI